MINVSDKNEKFEADDEKDFLSVVQIIQNHRNNAYRKINEELVVMNYEIGKYLSRKIKKEK